MRRAILPLLLGVTASSAEGIERVYFLSTVEDPSVTAECQREDTIRLGALVFAPKLRDGVVLGSAAEPVAVGSAVGCGKLLTYTPFDPEAQSPFAVEFRIGHTIITAHGTCTITSLSFPVADVPTPLVLAGCTLTVNADPSAGILGGSATSASVFLPSPLPGYRTGSYWTLRVYMDDLVSASDFPGGRGHRDRDSVPCSEGRK